MPDIKRLTVITHYCKDDPEFMGDYTSITVKKGDVVLAAFGDAYHDEGQAKLDGFIRGLRLAGWDVEVTEQCEATFLC